MPATHRRGDGDAVVAVEMGSIGAWVGAIATFAAVLLALGASEGWRGPRFDVTFSPVEPWCRSGRDRDGEVLWVRVAVENVGRQAARGCVGRLVQVTTDGEVRTDVDPVQLRWAGVPRSRAFEPIDIRRGQREFLNVLCLRTGAHWRIVTFEDPDFDPGFPTELEAEGDHRLRVAVFADNARTASCDLDAVVGGDERTIRLDGHATAMPPPKTWAAATLAKRRAELSASWTGPRPGPRPYRSD